MAEILNAHGSRNDIFVVPLTPRDFLGIVWSAALDACRELQILHERGQPPDHPALLNAPETSYLKCVIIRTI